MRTLTDRSRLQPPPPRTPPTTGQPFSTPIIWGA